MEKLLQGNPGEPIDWDGDSIFVIRYQAMTHAQGQMKGQAFADAEKWLKENEDRYVKLNSKKV